MPVSNPTIESHAPRAPRHGRRARETCARCSPSLGFQRRTIDTALGPVCAPCLEWLQISAQLPTGPSDSF